MFAHNQNHETHKPKSGLFCEMCDEEFTHEKEHDIHYKNEHEDGTWTCNNCDFQSHFNEALRKHMKIKLGHQPSEASMRQDIEKRSCYVCKNEFDGYNELMKHRKR